MNDSIHFYIYALLSLMFGFSAIAIFTKNAVKSSYFSFLSFISLATILLILGFTFIVLFIFLVETAYLFFMINFSLSQKQNAEKCTIIELIKSKTFLFSAAVTAITAILLFLYTKLESPTEYIIFNSNMKGIAIFDSLYNNPSLIVLLGIVVFVVLIGIASLLKK